MMMLACAAVFSLPLHAVNKRPDGFSKSEWKQIVQDDMVDAAEMMKNLVSQLTRVTAVLKKIKTEQGIDKGMKEVYLALGGESPENWDSVDIMWKNTWETDTGIHEETLQKNAAKLTKLKNALEKEICRVCALDPARGMDADEPTFGQIMYRLDPYADDNYEADEQAVYHRRADAGIPAKTATVKPPKKAKKNGRGNKSPQNAEDDDEAEEW